MSTSKTVHLDGSNFQDRVLKADRPVLVDFWAPWCGPCRVVAPAIDALAERLEGRALVGKLNVDEGGAIAARYGVRSIPTLAVFRDGVLVEQILDAVPANEIEAMVERHLNEHGDRGRLREVV